MLASENFANRRVALPHSNVTIVGLTKEVAMDKTLTHEAKVQLSSSLRWRYQAASSRAKNQILSEFVAVIGYHPKYAIHLLNAAEPSVPVRRRWVRPTLYGVTAIKGFLRTAVTNNSLILLRSKERQFCCGCRRSAALQPADFPNGAMPLTYVLIRILKPCHQELNERKK